MGTHKELYNDLMKKYTGKGNKKSSTNQSTGHHSTGAGNADSEHERIYQGLMKKYSQEVNDVYINSFFRDATSTIGMYGDQVDYKTGRGIYDANASALDDLGTRGRIISRHLEKNADRYENQNQLQSDMESTLSALRQYGSYLKEQQAFFSQWNTEEDYLAWKDYDEKSRFDLVQGRKEIEELEEELRGLKPDAGSSGANTYVDGRPYAIGQQQGSVGGTNPTVSATVNSRPYALGQQAQTGAGAASGNGARISELEEMISQKAQYLNQAKHIQDGIKLSSVTGNEDFQENSGYVSTKSDDWWEKLTSQYSMGYSDLIYEYINGGQNGMREEILGKSAAYNADSGSLSAADGWKTYDHMTGDEIAIYNYHYAKNGKEAAEEYLNSIQEKLNHRKATEMYHNMEGKTALELAFHVPVGLDQFESGVKNNFSKADYIPQTAIQMASGMAKEDLRDDSIPMWYNFKEKKWEDKVFGASAGQMAADVISTMSNMAPSVLTSAVANIIAPGSGAVVGNSLMFASTAGGAYQEALNLGYGKDQAKAYSALVGASEAGLQYLLGGIGKLGGKVSGNALNKMISGVDNAFARTALKLGGNMLSEGMEEGLQEALTPMFQNMAMHADEDIDWAQVAYSTLLGALTAGAMEGRSTISSEVGTYKTGKALQKAGISARHLAEIGKTFAADTVAHKLAGRVDENTGAYTMGRLFHEIGATLTEQNISEITEALVEKGMDREIAAKNARAMAAVVEGGELTDRQAAVIEANEELAEAVMATIIDPNAGWTQRTKGYHEALGALAQEKTGAATMEATGADNEQATEESVDISSMAEPAAEEETQRFTEPVRAENSGAVGANSKEIGSDVEERAEFAQPSRSIEEAAEDFGEQAGAVVNNYEDGQDVEDYVRGFRAAYDMGKSGLGQDYAVNSVFTRNLTEHQRKMAWLTGKGAAALEAKNAAQNNATKTTNGTTAAWKKGSVGVVKGHGVTVKDISKAFNVNQNRAYKVMSALAEVTGVDIELYQSTVDEMTGKLVSPEVDGVDLSDAAGAFSWKNDKIYIDVNAGVVSQTSMDEVAKYAMVGTYSHELTHFDEKWAPEEYEEFRSAVFEIMTNRGENVDELIEGQMARNSSLGYEQASREVVADAMSDILRDSRFVQKLSEEHATVFEKVKQKLKDFVKHIRDYFSSVIKSGKPEAKAVQEELEGGIRYLEEVVELWDKMTVRAVENYQAAQMTKTESSAKAENTTALDGGVQMEIREIGDTGRFYVQADRQVLTGSDPHAWGKQMEQYINAVIRKEQDVAFPTKDGHVLLLTGRSAYKLKDRHIASIQKKVERFLTDDAFALKGRAATHIDELIQVARFDKYEPDHNQKHKNDIGEDGFNYFDTYFKDFDGNYYQITLTAALNGQEETAYSIANIRKRRFPADPGSSSGQEALNGGRKPSENIIYSSEGKSQEVKTAIQLAFEKAFGAKSESEASVVREASHQRRFEELTDWQVLAMAAGEMDASELTPGEKTALELFEKRRRKLEDLESQRREQGKLWHQHQFGENGDRAEAQKARNRMTVLDEQIKRAHEDMLAAENAKLFDSLMTKARPVAEKRMLEDRKAELSKYRTMKQGENAVRPDVLPVTTDGINKVSRTARTVKGAGVTPDDFAELIDKEVYLNDGLTYIPVSNNETTKKAMAFIQNEGWDAALYKWQTDIRAGKVSAELTAIGALLLNNAARAGNRNTWLDILHDYQYMGTNSGQAVQALRILKQLSPSDQLYMANRSLDQMVKDMRLGFDITIDEELRQQYLGAKTAAQRDEIMRQIQKNVADQIPTTWLDKWTALRYLNMLGNMRTQIRNLAGNAGMKLTVKIKDSIAAGLEQIAYIASGGTFRRTKSLTVGKELMDAAKADFALVESLIQGGGKYSDSRNTSLEFARGVMEQRKIFKRKFLEKYRTLTNWAMDKGDVWFSRAAYARALAGYLKANGAESADFSKVDTALMNEARLYAVQEAQEATFRDTNALSGWAVKIGRRQDTPGAVKALSEGIMPFRKTPANILVRTAEYSPLGIFDSVWKSIQAVRGKSDVTGTQLVNSWAKSLTGTGLFFAGMMLHSAGMLVGGPDEDDEVEEFEDLNGQQNYALKIGDLYLTIDFLSPSAIPMFLGAQVNKMRQEGGIGMKELEGALTSLADPLIQMSMLQGVNETLSNIQYSENNIMQLALNATTSYLTQGLTNSLLGQIERGFEGVRMSTYVDKDSALPNWVQRTLGKASAKTPGLDYNQIPYIDAWGQEEQNPGVAMNLLYNLLSPSYFSKGTKDAVSRELSRLHEVNESGGSVFPSRPDSTARFTDSAGTYHKDYALSAEEYVALARFQGQTQREIVEELIGSKLYDELPDQYKVKAIQAAYDYAREHAQIEVLDRDGFSSQWMGEIEGDAAQGILAHVIGENAKGMYLNGDIAEAEAVSRRMQYAGENEEEANAQVAKWSFEKETGIAYSDFQEAFVDGSITPDKAQQYLEIYGGYSKTEAESKALQWQCEVDTGIRYDDIQQLYVDGEMTADRAKELRVEYGESSLEDARKTVLEWQCEKDNGIKYTDIDVAYLSGDITKQQAESWLVKYGEKTQEEAELATQAYRWRDEHTEYKDLSNTAIDRYIDHCEGAGISIPDFYAANKKASEIREAGGAQKENVVRYIRSLSLSRSQKWAMWYAVKTTNWEDNVSF